MFGNKKIRNVPPKPQAPLPEQMLEDLRCAKNEDVAFSIMKNEKIHGDDLHFPTNANDSVNVYRKVKTYLDVNTKLKVLDESLCNKIDDLKDIDREITRLAQEIKGQAKLALSE